EHVLEPVLVEAQRIAARDQAVADRRRRLDVLDGAIDVGLLERTLAARTDEPRTRAVAAVHRAEVRDEQEHAVRVAVHEARHGARVVLAERILLLARRGVELRERRHGRSAYALARITRVDEAHVVRRYTDRQRPLVARDRGALLVRHLDDLLELSERSDAVAVLPPPVVPVGALDTG